MGTVPGVPGSLSGRGGEGGASMEGDRKSGEGCMWEGGGGARK